MDTVPMKRSPSGTPIVDEDFFIWELYNFRCVCHPSRWAVCLHEDPPKSLNPRWEEEPWNRFPVCSWCHERAHSENILVMHELMCDNRARFFPEVQEYFDAIRSSQ